MSTKIFANTVEETAKKQIEELTESRAYKGCEIRIMPDVHAGAGCTIGTVIHTKNKVVPNTVGVDIGCGMLVCELGCVDVELETLDNIINKKVPSGFNIHDTAIFKFPSFFGLKSKSVLDYDMVRRSMGTLGGGNHFIELDVDDGGNKYLVIHSGSRNAGKRVAEYYQNIAIQNCSKRGEDVKKVIEELKSQGRQKDIQSEVKKIQPLEKNKELAFLFGETLCDYINDMEIMNAYADMNRGVIACNILGELNIVAKSKFTTRHNYIDTETGILRKGAVSAEKGEKLIIPMNMRDGSLLCTGKGNPDWLWSAPHGAGRIMSRRAAKENITIEDFESSMQGIYSTTICNETIDEAPAAYKPMQEIIDCIGDTVTIDKIIKPIYNFKAKDVEK
jgi:RNA-splicing ligase RtcB